MDLGAFTREWLLYWWWLPSLDVYLTRLSLRGFPKDGLLLAVWHTHEMDLGEAR